MPNERPLTLPGPLVDAGWLADHLESSSVRILDGSWYLPTQDRDARAEYLAGHIPGAGFFDIDGISDSTSELPHMLPSEIDFAAAVGDLGVGGGDAVVVYDGAGVFSAPRVWWMFRAFGHENIAVLQGGLPAWQAAGLPLEPGAPVAQEREFTARLKRELVRDAEAVMANIASGHEQVVDARSAGRFAGVDPEPRPGLKGGHIPGSLNLPYPELLDSRTGALLAPDVVRSRTAKAGIDLSRPITTTCGSGVSAALLALAFFTAGHTDTAVYDGSWAEWGALPESPIEK